MSHEFYPISLTQDQIDILQHVHNDGVKRVIDISAQNFDSKTGSVVTLPFTKTAIAALRRAIKKNESYPYSVTKTILEKMDGEGILDSIANFVKKAAPYVKKGVEAIKPIAEKIYQSITKPKVREYVSEHVEAGVPSQLLPPPPHVVGNAHNVYFQNGKWYMEGGALKEPQELPPGTMLVLDHLKTGGLLVLPGSALGGLINLPGGSLTLPGSGDLVDEGGLLTRPGDVIRPTNRPTYKVILPEDQKKEIAPEQPGMKEKKLIKAAGSLSLKYSEAKDFYNYDIDLPKSISLPDKALSSIDIAEFINKFPKLRKVFAGTFARDQLIEQSPDIHDVFIINTAPINSDIEMGHFQVWLGIEKLAVGSGIYDMLLHLTRFVGKLRRNPDKGAVLPYQSYTGPGNSMSKSYIENNPPQSEVDKIAFKHDLAYAKANKTPDKKLRDKIYHDADRKMIEELDALVPDKVIDKIYKPLARFAIATKYWAEEDKGAEDYDPPTLEKPEITPPEQSQLKELYGGALQELIEETDYKVENFKEYEEVLEIMKEQGLSVGSFFDSYGIEGIPEELGQLLSAVYPGAGTGEYGSKLRVFFNNEEFQSTSSPLCGHYCLFMIYAMFEKNLAYYEAVKILSENQPADSYIRKWCNIEK